ncbi:MAG: hypothetical protein ACRC7S_15715, partial [Cetobacterium sp.]
MNVNLQANPEYQFVSIDVNSMKPGTFYEMRVNRDQATALIEAPPFNVPFSNMKYFKHQLTTSHSIEIWEVRKHGDNEIHFNITNSVEWFIEKPSNTLTILSNT